MSTTTSAKVVVLGTDHAHVFALARTAQQSPATELVGIWAEQPDQRAAATEKLGVPALATVDEALALKPALVLIGALPAKRADLAARAIAAGAATLIDKPLAVTHEALDALMAAVAQHGKPAIAYYPYRGHPLVLAAKKLIDDGAIGRLVRVFAAGPHKLNAPNRPAWHWTRAGNGGALIDIGSHHADLCCWFAGEAPNWIAATHGNLTQPEHPEFQDFAQAQLRFPNGMFGHLEVDWLNPASMKNFGDTRFWFQGSTGKIELRLGDEVAGQLWTTESAAQPIAPLNSSEKQWDIELIEALAQGRPTAIPQEAVWLTSQVTLTAFDSAMRGGQPIEM